MGIKGAYWRKSEAEKYPPSTINADVFTHVFYATVFINNRTHHVSLSKTDKQLLPDFTSAAQQKKLKSLLSIGEAPNQNAFSNMASSKNDRTTFIKSSIEVATTYDFDGLDLYWIYPKSLGDMTNLGLLLHEWHVATKQKNLLLSAVVYFAPHIDATTAYPKTIANNVDFLNLVCYDYGIQDTTKTAAHALLNNPANPKKSTSSGIISWIHANVPAKKLVMGLPLYGRTWELKSPFKYKIGAPAIGYGPGENGVMEYDDILNFNNEHGATEVDDDDTVSTYSYANTSWIGYDTPSSVDTKIDFAVDHGLAGYLFWAIGMNADNAVAYEASSRWDN